MDDTQTTQPTKETQTEAAHFLADEDRAVQLVWQRLLYFRRMSVQRGKPYVHPEQKRDIANYLRLSVRTVKRAVSRLKELGCIATVRTGRRNRYYFLDQTPPSPGAKIGDTPGDMPGDTTRGIGDMVAPLMGHHGPSDGPPCPLALISDLNQQENNSSSSSAAAADLFAPLEMQDATTALVALDCPRPLIDDFLAQRGPTFALLAATFCAERLRDTEAKPIKNRVGFLVALFRFPERYGFSFINGRWELPPAKTAPAPQAPRETLAERLARQRAHLARTMRKNALE
jgi:hypothetical protein